MRKDSSWADGLLTGEILLIGTAEIAHLWGVLLHRPFSECVLVFTVLAAVLLAGAAALAAVRLHREGRGRKLPDKSVLTGNPGEWILLLILGLMIIWQILFTASGENIYRQGDMTVETVGSFLQSNGIYQVNPLTGGAYLEGIPLRLKILCLPALYGAICSIFRLDPRLAVWHVVPVITLISCYAAYSCLGRCLFPESRKKRLTFLIAVGCLLWAGSYAFGMDGFGVLYSGWRGLTIRNCVILPDLFSLCLRKKWFQVLLCAAAEACIVWTLYGLGAGVVISLGMAGIGFWLRHRMRGSGEGI